MELEREFFFRFFGDVSSLDLLFLWGCFGGGSRGVYGLYGSIDCSMVGDWRVSLVFVFVGVGIVDYFGCSFCCSAWDVDQMKILSIRERLGPFCVSVLQVISPWSWVSLKPTAISCAKVASLVLCFAFSFEALVLSESELVSLKSPAQITSEVSLGSMRSMIWSMFACALRSFGSLFPCCLVPSFGTLQPE